MCLICYVPPVNGFERVAAREASLRIEAPAAGCMWRRSTLAHWGRRGWGFMVRVCLGSTGCPSRLVQYQAVGRNSPPLQFVCRAAGAGEAAWPQTPVGCKQTLLVRVGKGSPRVPTGPGRGTGILGARHVPRSCFYLPSSNQELPPALLESGSGVVHSCSPPFSAAGPLCRNW